MWTLWNKIYFIKIVFAKFMKWGLKGGISIDNDSGPPKGQYISKCLLVSSFGPKCQRKYCKDFCPETFCSFLGASWKRLGLPVDFLIKMILLTKSPGSPKKLPGSPQEATKNFRAEILTLFSLLFRSKRSHKRHFEIN